MHWHLQITLKLVCRRLSECVTLSSCDDNGFIMSRWAVVKYWIVCSHCIETKIYKILFDSDVQSIAATWQTLFRKLSFNDHMLKSTMLYVKRMWQPWPHQHDLNCLMFNNYSLFTCLLGSLISCTASQICICFKKPVWPIKILRVRENIVDTWTLAGHVTFLSCQLYPQTI